MDFRLQEIIKNCVIQSTTNIQICGNLFIVK